MVNICQELLLVVAVDEQHEFGKKEVENLQDLKIQVSFLDEGKRMWISIVTIILEEND